MLNIVSKTHRCFQVCHLNARSLTKSKLDFMDCNFSNTDVNITKAWYKSALDNNVCNLQNYSIFRHERDDAIRGGGIAIYYRKGMKPAMFMKFCKRRCGVSWH